MGERSAMSVEIREVRGSGLAVLAPFLHARGTAIPYPHLAIAKVAYEGARIVGYAIYQWLPHVEPLEIVKDYRGGDLARRLADEITALAAANGPYLAVADSPFAARMCIERGLRPIEGQVFGGPA